MSKLNEAFKAGFIKEAKPSEEEDSKKGIGDSEEEYKLDAEKIMDSGGRGVDAVWSDRESFLDSMPLISNDRYEKTRDSLKGAADTVDSYRTFEIGGGEARLTGSLSDDDWSAGIRYNISF